MEPGGYLAVTPLTSPAKSWREPSDGELFELFKQ